MQVFIVLMAAQLIASTGAAEIQISGKALNDLVNNVHLKLIESSMDRTTDPCENFYQYACGNWDQLHTDIAKYHDYYRMIDFYTNKEMAIVLAESNQNTSTPEPLEFLRKLQAFYNSCVAVKKLRPLKYLRRVQEIDRIDLMLLPRIANLSNSQPAGRLDWLKHWSVFNTYGLSGIFLDASFYSNLGVLKLSRPLSESGFRKLSQDNYNVLSHIYSVTPNDTLRISYADVAQFELSIMQLAPHTKSASKLFTLKSLAEIPWLWRLVNLLLESTRFPKDKLRVLISDISYVLKLHDFVAQHDEAFVCEYLKIRFLWHLILNVPAKFSPETCAYKARVYMYLATDYVFERQHKALVSSVPEIQTMFANLKQQYRKLLLANPNGFNATVMQFLLDKLNGTDLVVGLLPRTNTERVLNSMYSMLNISATDYYGNQLQLLRFKANHTRLTLIPPKDRSDYVEHTRKLSPYFHRLYNIIVLPITTLQLPIYDVRLQDYYKYSSLGYILGHELTHGFDTSGTMRDGQGSVIEGFHDLIHANPKFRQNLACLKRLNHGNINEKISDVTGFRVAFQTYFELHPKARLTPVSVHGRNMTLDKLFFLNHAQFRCSTAKETPFIDRAHGTPEDRIMDALAHFPDFVKTFECPRYADMYLEESCQLWRR